MVLTRSPTMSVVVSSTMFVDVLLSSPYACMIVDEFCVGATMVIVCF